MSVKLKCSFEISWIIKTHVAQDETVAKSSGIFFPRETFHPLEIYS